MHRKLANKRHARQLQFCQRLQQERRTKQGVAKTILKLRGDFKHLPISAAFPVAPRLMCFLRNPEGMGKFISELTDSLRQLRPVLVQMEDVDELELNAITVLLAVMVQFRSKGIKFSGTNPINTNARKTLNQSGFFDHLSGRFQANEPYDIFGTSIHTHGKLLVDSEFSQGLIDRASTTIWGEERRCPGVQRVLIELMHNTVNHASGDGEGHKHYWISVQQLKDENRTVFCFVDFGVGIFESLSRRRLTAESFVENVYRLFGFISNARILELILTGGIHRTVTDQYFRGKGLPGVYEALRKNQISNLSIITNDVYFTATSNTYKIMNTEFAGTFYSWELSQANPSLPK